MIKCDIAKAPGCELYIVGWPCQGSSNAGERKGFKDKRSQVFYAVAQYIRHRKPCVALLEDVLEQRAVNGGRDFREVLAELEKVGSCRRPLR
eukprot:7624191-Pyramimonas_sp.AAC.1